MPVTPDLVMNSINNLLQILGGFDARNQIGWNQRLITTLLGLGGHYADYGLQRLAELYGPAREHFLDWLNRAGELNLGETALQNELRVLSEQLGSMALDPSILYRTPEQMNPWLERLGDVYGDFGALGDLGRWMMSGDNPMMSMGGQMASGATDWQQALRQQGIGLLSGQNRYSDAILSSVADAASRGGLTPEGRQAFEAAMASVGQRGMTPELMDLFGLGRGIVSADGRTAASDRFQQMGLQTLMEQGMTPELGWMASRGMGLASINPLLSTEQAINMAADRAATERAQAAESLIRRAQARGGGPSVISGLQSGALAEFDDQMLRAAAQARQQAAIQQQGLGLEQLRAGLGAIGQAAGAASERERIAAQLGLTPEQIAAQRLGIGADIAGGAARTGASVFSSSLGEASRLGLGGQEAVLRALGLIPAAAEIEQARMGLGSGMLGQLGQSIGVGSGMINDAMRTGGGLYEAAMRGRTGVIGQFGDIFNTNVANNLRATQIAQSGRLTPYELLSGSMGRQWRLPELGVQGTLGIGNEYGAVARGGIGIIGGLNPMSPVNPWAGLHWGGNR